MCGCSEGYVEGSEERGRYEVERVGTLESDTYHATRIVTELSDDLYPCV